MSVASAAGVTDPVGERSSLATAARHGAVGIFGSAVAAIAGLALNAVVGRSLGVAASGVLFVVIAVVTVVSTVSKLGADTGLVWSLSRGRALGRDAEAGTSLWAALVPVVVVSVVLAVVSYLVAGPMAHRLVEPGKVGQTTQLLQIGAAFIVVAGPALVVVAALRGAGRIVPYAILQNVVIAGSRPVLIMATTAAGLGLVGAMWAWCSPFLAALVVAGVMVRTTLARRRARAADGQQSRSFREVFHEFWWFSWARAVSSVVEIAIVWSDVLIVAALTGSRQAGIYAAASRFVTTGTLFEASMRVALAPGLSARLAVDDLAGAGVLHRASTQWIILLSWPVYIALAIYAPVVLDLFGKGFREGAWAMSLLCTAMLVAMAGGNSQTVLLMSGRSRWSMVNKSVALTLNVILNLMAVPRWGIQGAAVSWSVVIVLEALVVIAEVRWVVGVPVGLGPVLAAMTAGVVSFGLVGLAVRMWLGLTPWTVVGGVVVSMAIHAVLLYRYRDVFKLTGIREAFRRRGVAA